MQVYNSWCKTVHTFSITCDYSKWFESKAVGDGGVTVNLYEAFKQLEIKTHKEGIKHISNV